MIEKIIRKFGIEGEIISVSENKSGIINSTFVVIVKKDNGIVEKYLVQKINTSVFLEPYKLMKNIEEVTSYLQTQIKKEHDSEHKVLNVIKARNGKSLCYLESCDGERDYYRIYKYIDNAVSYDGSVDPHIIYNVGKAFGNFQKLLRNYPIGRLLEIIPNFHSTDIRYKKFMEDVRFDSEDRVMDVAKEIVFILKREDICSLITEQLGTESVPYRVTHNDTKVSNVLINKETGEYLAVIDLDTVMPGSLLFDYGDGVRSTASTAKEDEKDLSKVSLDLELFRAYTDGYLSEMAPFITYEELSLMPESIRIITLELAIRFLNDYINGDTYFKTSYETHNLDRARNQIALVADIESKMEKIRSIIFELYDKYKEKSITRSRKK